MRKLSKEPSLLRQIIDAYIERQKTRKALRLLAQQEWSIDFLTTMLIRCANHSNRPYEMTIINKNGHAIMVKTVDEPIATYKDESIFNHLDDEMRVRRFIDEVNKR